MRKRKKTATVPTPAIAVDMVNHPPHYIKGTYETLAVIEDVVQFYNGVDAWSAGNVIRYLSRAPHKGNFVEDLKKAQFYMNNLVSRK